MPAAKIHLDELAAHMGKSSWQLEELAAIKSKPGYRFFGLILRTLDVLCCSNLYSHIGSKTCWLAAKLDDDNGTRTMRHLSALAPTSESTWVRQSELLRQSPALDEPNERVFGRKRRFTLAVFLSRVVLVVCIGCQVGLCMSMYFQYRLDYYLFHLARFNTSQLIAAGQNRSSPEAGQSLGSLSYRQRLAVEAELQVNERRARAATKIFGSVWRNWPYFSEAYHLLLLLCCCCTYLGAILHYRLIGFDFHYLRMALDWDREQANCNRMIVHMIKQFVESSKNFSHHHESRDMELDLKLGLDALGNGHETRRHHHHSSHFYASFCERPRTPAGLPSRAMTSLNVQISHKRGKSSPTIQPSYSDEHEWIIGELKHLALAGRLQPLDRLEVDYMNSRMLLYSTLMMLATCSLANWNVLLLVYLLPFEFDSSPEGNFMDLVALLEYSLVISIGILSGVFYLGLVFICSIEQGRLMDRLRAMIARFVTNNRRVLVGLPPLDSGCKGLQASLDPIQEEREVIFVEPYASINSDLLLILMHYRLFAAQLRPAQKSLGFWVLACVGIMVSFPIFGRLHVPYINDRMARFICIIICLVIIGSPDIALVPLCRMNSRCLDLCRSLWTLMATLVAMEDQPKFCHLLNRHSVLLLRKELSHPERLESQFAIATLGWAFTYAELLKLHFWLGLVVLLFVSEIVANTSSSTHQAPASEGILGSLLSDPLGIISGFRVQASETE